MKGWASGSERVGRIGDSGGNGPPRRVRRLREGGPGPRSPRRSQLCARTGCVLRRPGSTPHGAGAGPAGTGSDALSGRPSSPSDPCPDPLCGPMSQPGGAARRRRMERLIVEGGQQPQRDVPVTKHEAGSIKPGNHLATERPADEIGRPAVCHVSQDRERQLQCSVGAAAPVKGRAGSVAEVRQPPRRGPIDDVHLALLPAPPHVVAVGGPRALAPDRYRSWVGAARSRRRLPRARTESRMSRSTGPRRLARYDAHAHQRRRGTTSYAPVSGLAAGVRGPKRTDAGKG